MIFCSSFRGSVQSLVDIMKGKSLAIKGPPGTGKSQTIDKQKAVAVTFDFINQVSENTLLKKAKLIAIKRKIIEEGV